MNDRTITYRNLRVSKYLPSLREQHFKEKGGLLERSTKRIEGSHGTLQYYLEQHTSTLFSIPYCED